MDKSFNLKIITPLKIVFAGEVASVKAPGIAGYFGVLANHAPFLAALTIGVIEIRVSSGKKTFATSNGFAKVLNNNILILVESAESADTIDVERARQARERALRRLEGKKPETDIARAKLALARALNRLRIAGVE